MLCKTAAKKGDLSLGLCPLEIDRLSSKHTHQQWNSDVLSGGIFFRWNFVECPTREYTPRAAAVTETGK